MRLIGGVSLALVAAVMAGCPVTPVAPGNQPSQAPLTRKAVAGSVVTGKLIAPANIIAADGASIIASDGASIIAADGASIIAADGAGAIARQRRVLQTGERRLSGARVYLSADAGGAPVPGLEAKTDAKGQFSFPAVPVGHTLVLVAKFTLKNGREGELRTMLRTNNLGSTVQVDAATAMTTAAVLDGKSGALGDFNPDGFSRAVEETRRNLTPGDLPDWTSPADVIKKVNELIRRVTVVEGKVDVLEKTVADLKQEVEQNKKSTATIHNEVEQIKQSNPPVPTPSASPETQRFGLPTNFVMEQAQQSFKPGAWSYGSVPIVPPSPMPANGAFELFQWGVHDSSPTNVGYINTSVRDAALIMYKNGTFAVHPAQSRDTLIIWLPPASGSLRVTATAALVNAQGTDGVRLSLYNYNSKTRINTKIDEVLIGPGAPQSLDRRVGVTPDDRLTYQFHRMADAHNDTVRFSTELELSPN